MVLSLFRCFWVGYNFGHSDRYVEVYHCDFNLHFLMANDKLFMFLFAMYLPSVKCKYLSLVHCLIEFFLTVKFQDLYIF